MDTGPALIVLAILALVLSWYLATGAWARILIAAARRTAGLRNRAIDVNGLRWHYLEGGTGPLLVALHGFGGDADNWLRVARGLGRHFRIIAPDLPGFGDSDAPGSLPFDIPSQSARLNAFLEALGEVPEFIAGNSMGGWLACAYTLEHSESVRAIWLLAPLGVASGKPSPLLKAIESDRQSPISITNESEFKARVVQPMFGRPPWIPRPLLRFYASRAARQSADSARRFREVLESPRKLEAIVGETRVPIHLQWGSLDRAVNPDGVRVLLQTGAEIDAHLLEGVGHLPMLESAGESKRLWISFCRRMGLLETSDVR